MTEMMAHSHGTQGEFCVHPMPGIPDVSPLESPAKDWENCMFCSSLNPQIWCQHNFCTITSN